MLCGVVGFQWIQGRGEKKIAVIRTKTLFEGYLGMKEAQELYQKKVAGWSEEIELLTADFQAEMELYDKEAPTLSEEDQKERRLLIQKKEVHLKKQAEQMKATAMEEEGKLTNGVVTQLNAFVKQYAEDQGYDVVWGTVADGNILYADGALDITDEVLKALNEAYEE